MTTDLLDQILSQDDAATLTDLIERGLGENSQRAVTSDMRYLDTWALAATGSPLPAAPSLDLVLKFVAHHFWTDVDETDAARGMPSHVLRALQTAGYLANGKPHATSTLRRRLSTWRSVCTWSGNPHPFDDPRLKKVLRLASRSRATRRKRHSQNAITRDIVLQMTRSISADCTPQYDVFDDNFKERLVAFRDRAMIGFAFASGGRRRSEVAMLTVAMIDGDLDGAYRGTDSLRIEMGRTKTTDGDDGFKVYLAGDAAAWLRDWLRVAKITRGAVFRRIDRWGNIGTLSLSPAAVNQVVKQRLAEIDEDPRLYSAHGLRSGFLTTAAMDGVPLGSAMAQSGHRSTEQAMSYFNEVDRRNSAAVRILEDPASGRAPPDQKLPTGNS